jgi:NAD(P)-dependent dehydrogenase (short-subunit alcohol dehydrogenase family)
VFVDALPKNNYGKILKTDLRERDSGNARTDMVDRLKDKVALVVGAGSIGPGWGNGKATAVAFAREGARVFCADVNQAAAEETVAIIKGEGGNAMAHRADASKAADVAAMVQVCASAYERIDVLDNNVGIAEFGGVVEVSEAAWDKVFAVQSQKRLSHHEARDPADGSAGRRLNHQHLVGCFHALQRHPVCHLLCNQGRAQPSYPDHRGRICKQARPSECNLAWVDEDADGREERSARANLCRR